MKGKDNKPKSLKFYLCLVGILAAAYIVMTGILAIRNPKTEPETSSTSVSVLESSSSSEVDDQADNFGEENPSGDRVGTEQAEIPESEQRSIVTDDYGRGKKRYTKMEAQDVFTWVNVSVTNAEELESIVGASMVDEMKKELEVLTPVYFPDGTPEISEIRKEQPEEMILSFYFRKIGTDDGKNWVVAFTDISECEKGGQTATFPMLFTDLIGFALDTAECDGIAINPFGYHINIPKDILKKMLELSKPAPQKVLS